MNEITTLEKKHNALEFFFATLMTATVILFIVGIWTSDHSMSDKCCLTGVLTLVISIAVAAVLGDN